MDTTWLESVGGVALGALIGSVPAGLAIRAENRRFESLGVAEYEAAEARDLRDCLVPMMQCVAVWAFASEQIFQNTGETQLVRDLRLKAFIDDADHKLVSKLGEIRTNPRAKPFEERYLGIRDEWNQFVKYRTRDQWTDGTSPLYKSVTNSLLQLAEYFSADCRSILRELNAPASIRRRSVRPVWKGVLNVQMQDATPKSVVERKSRRWRRQADD